MKNIFTTFIQVLFREKILNFLIQQTSKVFVSNQIHAWHKIIRQNDLFFGYEVTFQTLLKLLFPFISLDS